MKTIEVYVVEGFVKGVLHLLDLLEAHLRANKLDAVEIELINAKGELQALLRELDTIEPTYRTHEYRDTGRRNTDETKPDEP